MSYRCNHQLQPPPLPCPWNKKAPVPHLQLLSSMVALVDSRVITYNDFLAFSLFVSRVVVSFLFPVTQHFLFCPFCALGNATWRHHHRCHHCHLHPFSHLTTIVNAIVTCRRRRRHQRRRCCHSPLRSPPSPIRMPPTLDFAGAATVGIASLRTFI